MAEHVPSDADLRAMAGKVGAVLKARGWCVATAESCTGGWIAKALTDIPGSSAWLECGIVSYSDASKTALLGVEARTLAANGAVSEATVRAMAAGALAVSDADIAVAVSGIAGPGGATATKAVGTVCLAWVTASGSSLVETRHFGGDRDAVRRQTVIRALSGIANLAQREG